MNINEKPLNIFTKRIQNYWQRLTYCLQVVILVAQMIKNLLAVQETQVWSLGQEDSWRRKWLPTPVFLPGEFHGQKSLVGYSPWGHKESDRTEQLTLSLSMVVLVLGGKYLDPYLTQYVKIPEDCRSIYKRWNNNISRR